MEKQQARTALIVLILCCGGYILSMFHRACPAIIALDLGRDLGLDNTGLGLMSGATLLAYGLMQLPSGLLADRLGGRRSLALLLALGGLCAMGFASSHSAAAAVSFRFLEGIGLAITIPAMVILAGCYPPQSFGRAYSIFLSSGGIGTILAARPLAELNALWGWRLSIIGFSLLTLALAAAVWLLIREPAAILAHGALGHGHHGIVFRHVHALVGAVPAAGMRAGSRDGVFRAHGRRLHGAPFPACGRVAFRFRAAPAPPPADRRRRSRPCRKPVHGLLPGL